MFIITNDQKNDHLDTNEQEKVIEPATDLSWESLASVEQSRQNDIISDIYRLANRVDEDQEIEAIKNEWKELSDDNEYLEAEFEKALQHYEKRQEEMKHAREMKNQLVREAQELQESTRWAKTSKRLQAMQKSWKEAGFAGQGIDQELWDQFSAANDVFFNRQNEFFEKREELQEQAAEAKEKLIEEAESIKESSEWKETSAQMRDLMNRWKEAGFASREIEDELWERFNSARQYFYQRQHEHFDEMRARHARSREIKKGLIEEAKKLTHSFDFDESRSEMDALFARWKDAGSAGKEHEQNLWSEFKSHQDEFFQRYHEWRRSSSEQRMFDMEEELNRLDVRINALREVSEMVQNKLDNFDNMEQLDEEQQKEQAELTQTLADNRERLEAYENKYRSIQEELDRY